MTSIKTPIRPEDVKERAARKLAKARSRQSSRDGGLERIHGVKPVHVTKADPLVRRITSQ